MTFPSDPLRAPRDRASVVEARYTPCRKCGYNFVAACPSQGLARIATPCVRISVWGIYFALLDRNIFASFLGVYLFWGCVL